MRQYPPRSRIWSPHPPNGLLGSLGGRTLSAVPPTPLCGKGGVMREQIKRELIKRELIKRELIKR
jgi:hypothetical protein